jgi:hypothetical protein
MSEPLRPMSTGELLDRTITLYRHNFPLFVAIGMVGPAAGVVFQVFIVGMRVLPATARSPHVNVAVARFGLGMLVGWAIWLAGLAVSHAVTVRAVAAVHLDHNISIAGAYRSLVGHFGRVLGIFFLVVLICGAAAVLVMIAEAILTAIVFMGALKESPRWASISGVAMAMVAIAAFIVVYVRYALAIQACVVEDLGVRASLKRSASLSKGSRWRIGVIYVVFFMVSWAVGSGLNYLARRAGVLLPNRITAVILIYASSFVGGSITAPLSTIAISLAYYDERVRREAFDLQVMLSSLEEVSAPEIAVSELAS